MPFNISWYEEQRIIYAHGVGVVTLDDVVEINQTVWEISQKAGEAVHCIINSVEVKEMPIAVSALISAIDLFNTPGFGWLVHVTQNAFVSFMFKVAAQVTNTPYLAVKSVDEAFAFLEQQDMGSQYWGRAQAAAGGLD